MHTHRVASRLLLVRRQVVVLMVVAPVVWTLVVASMVDVSLLTLMRTCLMVETSTVHPSTLSTSQGIVERLRSPLLATRTLVELECWLQKHGEQVDQVLRAVEAGNLSLVLLVLPLVLGSLVHELLISYESHFLWVAVFNVESILRLKKHITSKVFGHLALILLFEVHKGLLGARNDLNLCDFSLAGRRKVDFQLLFSCSDWEVLDKEAEEHDGLLVFEVSHHELMLSLRLFLGFSDVEVS